MNIFDCLSQISYFKDRPIDQEGKRILSPYQTNRFFSRFRECLPYVNEMNLYHGLDSDIQYDFLQTLIPRKDRRFGKWVKPDEESDLVQLIQDLYEYSRREAEQVATIFTEEQIEEMKRIRNFGGVSRKKL